MQLGQRCLSVGILLFCVAIGKGWPNSLLGYATAGILLLMCVFCVDIYWHQPANTHSFRTLLGHYIIFWITRVFGPITKYSFDTASKKRFSQEQCLKDILKGNSGTLYAIDHNFSEIHNVQEFLNKCPLTVYSDYKTYIDDIVDNGTCDVLFPGKTDFIAMTAGTTSGKGKMFPKSLKIIQKNQILPMLLFHSNIQKVPGMKKLLKQHMIRIGSRKMETALKVQKGPMSIVLSKANVPFFCSPPEIFEIYTDRECLYLHSIFGLKDPYVVMLSGVFTTVLLTFIKTLEDHWETICDSIETGILPSELEIPHVLRNRLETILGKDKNRADHLRLQFRHGFKNIIGRIWPDCAVVTAVDSGSFQAAADILRRNYLGNIPLTSIFHIGSEGFYGIRMDSNLTEPTEYTILGTHTFFEFVPLSNIDQDQPNTLLSDQVKVNSDYELVITTQEGLYRYRTEDVVRITGFYNQFPKYKYLYRSGDILNLQTEKMPEVLISQAILEVSHDWYPVSVTEFVSVENCHLEKLIGEESGKLFYVVFIEVSGGQFDAQAQSTQVDSKLCDLVEYYSVFRKKGTIKCLQMLQVLPGTFAKLRGEILSANPESYSGQFKMPRIIRKEKLLKVLQSHISKQ